MTLVKTKPSSKIKTHQMRLITTAPVFIGSGESINQILYFKQDDFIYTGNDFDILQAYPHLLNDFREMMTTLVTQKSRNESRSRQINLKSLLKKYDLDPEKLVKQNILKKFITYEDFVTGEIQLFQSTAHGFSIPGSSIKGAIRQLLLKHLLRKNVNTFKSTLLSPTLTKEDMNRREAQNIENKLLRPYTNSATGKTGGMLNDLLRAVRISDSGILPNDFFEVDSVRYVNLEKESHPKPMQINQLCLQPKVEVLFNISLDLQLLEEFNKGDKNLPFKDIESLLSILSEETKACQEEMKTSTKLAKINITEDDSIQPNFFLGANTGFDRHTLWNVYPTSETRTQKIKILPWLPTRPKRTPRDNDRYVPRGVRTVFQEELDYLSYGWSRLEVKS